MGVAVGRTVGTASVPVRVVGRGFDALLPVLVGVHHGLADVLLGMKENNVELGREQAHNCYRG